MIQTAVVTIISYKPPSGLSLLGLYSVEQYSSYMPSSPLGSISPRPINVMPHYPPLEGGLGNTGGFDQDSLSEVGLFDIAVYRSLSRL